MNRNIIAVSIAIVVLMIAVSGTVLLRGQKGITPVGEVTPPVLSENGGGVTVGVGARPQGYLDGLETKQVVCGDMECMEGESYADCSEDCDFVGRPNVFTSNGSTTISWDGEKPSTAVFTYLTYEKGKEQPNVTRLDELSSSHSVVLKLPPDSEYDYSISSYDENGELIEEFEGELYVSRY